MQNRCKFFKDEIHGQKMRRPVWNSKKTRKTQIKKLMREARIKLPKLKKLPAIAEHREIKLEFKQ